jgi:hypothetical protein
MSQSGLAKITSTNLPGTVPTSFVTDIGTAIPIAHVLDILGGTGITISAAGNVITVTNTAASSTTFNTDSGTATTSGGAITFHGVGGLLFSGSGSTVTGTLAAIPNASLANSSVTVTAGTGLTGGGTVSLGGTITLSLAGGGTALETLSDDVAAVVTPLANNIQLVGHVVEQGATKFSTVVAGTNLLNINPMSESRWIVDPLGFNGTHTTIQAAITAATSGDTVFIMDGTYTENLTLKAGVNLCAWPSSTDDHVTISGKATFTAAGTVNIAGLRLQTNSDFLLAVTGSAASIVNLINCNLNCTNNTGISFTSSSASATINIRRCNGDLGTTGIAFHSMSSVGTMSYRYSNFTNSGGSSTAASNSAGTVSKQYCRYASPVSVSGAGILEKLYVYADTSATNTTTLTTAGTGTSTARYCDFKSGTVSSISVGTGTTVNLFNSVINSSNTNAITGLGTLNYSNIEYVGTSNTMNTTGQLPFVISNSRLVVVTPGAYPYTTSPQDDVILVDTSAARTIIPHVSPGKGQKYTIKDSVGTAATFNITITPSGKNIDGNASFVIKNNYGSITIVYNGTEFSII